MKRSRRDMLLFPGALALLAGRSDALLAEQERRVDIDSIFTPSGWMGDGEHGRKYIEFNGADRTAPRAQPASIKIVYTFGPTRWAGIYWQNQPDNWGDRPGNNYAGRGFSGVEFWARGQNGNERVEFKAGGISQLTRPFRDSFGVSAAATTGKVFLKKDWTEYRIDLAGADLSSVIGGFCWVASADQNPGTSMAFYIEGVFFQ